VLNGLIYGTPLESFGYRIVHYDSPDPRGVDVALLYRHDKFRVLHQSPIRVRFPFDTASRTRDIVYVKGIACKKDTMHIFVNALIVPFTVLTPILIGFGLIQEPRWKSFGKYSIFTGILIFVFGGLSAVFFMNKLPYFGLVERLNIGMLQIWTFYFSYKLNSTI